MKWLKEIHAVGFINWCWFVLYLKRDEFHWSLDKLKKKGGKYLIHEREYRRRLAHEIDLTLSSKPLRYRLYSKNIECKLFKHTFYK